MSAASNKGRLGASRPVLGETFYDMTFRVADGKVVGLYGEQGAVKKDAMKRAVATACGRIMPVLEKKLLARLGKVRLRDAKGAFEVTVRAVKSS